ncbi:MAG: GIY-YIG nuclease family protein [Burkholderiales bacterium]|nr:GIY-YIG nuclease family protein [Burkholderiales bacterium]
MTDSGARTARTTQPRATAGTQTWYVYLLECRNGAYYAGVTNDLARRYAQHLAGKGAKYTRANPPQRMLGSRAYADRGEALSAEHAIRQLPRHRKVAYLAAIEPGPGPGRARAVPGGGRR